MTDELIEADLTEARGALRDLADRRSELRAASEDEVVQWRWAREGSDLQRPEPLYRERYGQPAPLLLADPPVEPHTEHEYGFDAAGHIVVVREHMGTEGFREELRVPRSETVVGYRWSQAGEPLEVNIARFSGGKIRSYVVVWPRSVEDALHGWTAERYAYDGDLVFEIQTESDIALGDAPLDEGPKRIRASYDALGRVREVREHSDSGEKVLYRARGTGPSMGKSLRHVEDRLVETVPRIVRERGGDEPIYCLALHYQAEWPLPPTVGLGLDRDRQAWMRRIDDSETLKLTLWNPAEFRSYRDETVTRDLTKIDPALARAIDAIPDTAEGAADLARTTLNRVARRLQHLDWRTIAPVTDDFAVFAVDYELVHLDDNLRQSVPASLRTTLARRALI